MKIHFSLTATNFTTHDGGGHEAKGKNDEKKMKVGKFLCPKKNFFFPTNNYKVIKLTSLMNPLIIGYHSCNNSIYANDSCHKQTTTAKV